jgi:excinuclease ABC subunit C
MRDDKRFFLIKINAFDKFPMIKLVRLKKNDGAAYFGPFPRGGAIRETAEFLSAHLGLRVCKADDPGIEDYWHCLAGTIARCSAPCIGGISEENYKKRIDALISLLHGNRADILNKLSENMIKESGLRNFEKAAKLRDISENIKSLFRGDRTFQKTYIKSGAGADSVAALKKDLSLKNLPVRIEAFDISNISGSLAVAGMVSFLDGKPDKQNYRRFRMRDCGGPDDFSMIKEAVFRRYKRLIEEKKNLPGLILVDGGKGQLSAALEALKILKSDFIPIAAIAKKKEEIFIPSKTLPIILDEHSPALKLLQAVRDEAHRFALNYHRGLRDRRIEDSMLDDMPGIGKKRKILLLKEFGSVENIKKYDVETIINRVPGIGAKFAKVVCNSLKKN